MRVFRAKTAGLAAHRQQLTGRLKSLLSLFLLLGLFASGACKKSSSTPTARRTTSTSSSLSGSKTCSTGLALFSDENYRPEPVAKASLKIVKEDLSVLVRDRGHELSTLELSRHPQKDLDKLGFYAWMACKKGKTDTKNCSPWKKEYRDAFEAVEVPSGKIEITAKLCVQDPSYIKDDASWACNSSSNKPEEWCCGAKDSLWEVNMPDNKKADQTLLTFYNNQAQWGAAYLGLSMESLSQTSRELGRMGSDCKGAEVKKNPLLSLVCNMTSFEPATLAIIMKETVIGIEMMKLQAQADKAEGKSFALVEEPTTGFMLADSGCAGSTIGGTSSGSGDSTGGWDATSSSSTTGDTPAPASSSTTGDKPSSTTGTASAPTTTGTGVATGVSPRVSTKKAPNTIGIILGSILVLGGALGIAHAAMEVGTGAHIFDHLKVGPKFIRPASGAIREFIAARHDFFTKEKELNKAPEAERARLREARDTAMEKLKAAAKGLAPHTAGEADASGNRAPLKAEDIVQATDDAVKARFGAAPPVVATDPSPTEAERARLEAERARLEALRENLVTDLSRDEAAIKALEDAKNNRLDALGPEPTDDSKVSYEAQKRAIENEFKALIPEGEAKLSDVQRAKALEFATADINEAIERLPKPTAVTAAAPAAAAGPKVADLKPYTATDLANMDLEKTGIGELKSRVTGEGMDITTRLKSISVIGVGVAGVLAAGVGAWAISGGVGLTEQQQPSDEYLNSMESIHERVKQTKMAEEAAQSACQLKFPGSC